MSISFESIAKLSLNLCDVSYSTTNSFLNWVNDLKYWNDSPDWFAPCTQITVSSSEIELGIENFMLSLGTLLGIIDTDLKFSLFPPLLRYFSEVAFIQLGDASIVGIPGELYPEIAVGGIENPEGADYVITPQEVPNLRSQFPEKLNLMVNLANDAIGYIIPKSEWDEDAPWIYGENEETYGEIVSLGPNTAPIIHEKIIKLIEESKK